MKPYCTITVPGVPRPAGSKSSAPHIRDVVRPPGPADIATSHAFREYLKVAVVLGVRVFDAGTHTKAWQKQISLAAQQLRLPPPVKGCEYAACFRFYMPRPNYHYQGNDPARPLRADCPRRHSVAPDATKLVRAVEDALTGSVWFDDAEIVRQRAVKVYGTRPGVIVKVFRLSVPEVAAGKPRKVLDRALLKKAGMF